MDVNSRLSAIKTKDEFLTKAHEARQARELARRQENAAIVIQSHVRKFLTCKRLRDDVLKEQQKLHGKVDGDECLRSIRRILFICHLDKDLELIDSMLLFVHDFMVTGKSKSFISIKEDQSLNSDNELNPKSDRIELTCENFLTKSEQNVGKNLGLALLKLAVKDEDEFMYVIRQMFKLCLFMLKRPRCNQSDPRSMVIYLRIINFISSDGFLSYAQYLTSEMDCHQTDSLVEVIDRLARDTFEDRKTIFVTLSEIIIKFMRGANTEVKANLLDEFVLLALGLMGINQTTKRDVNPPNKLSDDVVDVCIRLLSLPALTYYLDKNSSDIISKLKEKETLKMLFLVANGQRLQHISSTPSLCVLANLIHLSSMNLEILTSSMTEFVTAIIKLLEICQRNMKQSSSNQTNARNKSNRKPNDSTDESYNHILGWLTREQTSTIDQETSKLIKEQLNHLWSMKLLKILLKDLIKTNVSSDLSKGNQSSKLSVSTSLEQQRSFSIGTPNRKLSNISDNQTCDTSSTPLASLRRAVERATINVTKTINSSYVKSTGSSGAHTSCAKLMTEEAKRIAMVCLMLHTALKTLKMIKQDVLTGLCFHDYVLRNLWYFIRSLGSQNGLKVFLDYLTIHTKTNMPEFHILMLFCECASHIISILDDPELYEQQRPFTIDDLVEISFFLNIFVYRLISNQLVSFNMQDMDPILQTTHRLLTDLYKRDCRRKFAPQDHWLIKEVKMSLFLKDLETGKPVTQAILNLIPHVIPHKERVLIFRKLVYKDRTQYSNGYSTFITIHRSRIVEDGYQQLARLPPNALKGLIRVKFINDHGLDEAGIDQDGVFKEFLEDTIKRVFDPALNLFCTTSEQCLYPSPTSRIHEDHLSLFNFVGKMLGKAVYEGIVVDVPFATFFLSRVLGQHHSALYSPIDELPSLDPELYKSLTYIKHYEGDVSELDLTFSLDQEMMGKIESYELESGGKFIPVTRESKVRYIHSVANFRMRTQIEEQTEAFVRGFKSIINLEWLHMFSATELQRLISGDTAPIDLQDLRKHTRYFGGFHNNHRVVCWLWDILEKDFSPEDHRLFLKFVTSCSKPPLLSFANLEPPFSIRCVEVSDDQDSGDTVGSVLRGFFAIRRSDPVDRLPTSSTCFNLLKLPNYQRRSTLREKLRYAIRCSPGFELS